MADVNQSLGLDASQAIKELGRLAVTIDVANAAIGRLQKATAADPTGGVAAAAKQAQNSITALNRTVGQFKTTVTSAGSAGVKAGLEVTASWETVGRVFAGQLISRALTTIIREFSQASEAAIEFQLTIARTAAIAGEGALTSYAALSAEVRQLAIDLGRPIAEVQSAAFQTLQNDVGNVTESLQFLREASDLAIATGSELETASNSLTSVLKSYGQEVTESARNSDILFKAVDVGRISLDELENRLGTLTPQAAALGVTFSEVASAVASATLSGLDTAKAATQIRNIFAKLVRPTKDLQNAFERLGVTSGQELVKQYGGLQGALNALTTAFDGNEIAVANAFGTIRGQLGVLNLLANEGKEFTRVLGEVEDSSGSLQAAVGEVNQTNARVFQLELAKVNDTMLELGNLSLKLKTNLAGLFNTLIPDARTAIGVTTSLGAAGTAAFTGYALAATKAAAATLLALGPLRLISAALAGIAAFQFINIQTLEGSLGAVSQEAAAAQRSLQNKVEENQTTNEKLLSVSLDRQKNLLGDFVKEAATFYAENRKNFENENQRITITTDRTIEDFGQSRKDLVENLFSFIESIDDRLLESFGRVRDARKDLEDLRFESAQRGLTDLQKATNLLARSQSEAAQARQQFATSGFDETRQETARESQQISERRAQDALRAAERVDNINLIRRAEQNLQTIVEQRASAEQKISQRLANFNEAEANRQADRVERIRQDQEALLSELQSSTAPRDEKGVLRPTDAGSVVAQEKNIQRIRAELSSLERELQSIELIDVASQRNFTNKTKQSFEQGIGQARVDFSQSIQDLERRISSTKFKAIIDLEPNIIQSSVDAIRDELAAGVTGSDPGQRLQQGVSVRNDFVTQQQEAEIAVQRLNADLSVQAIRIRSLGEQSIALGRTGGLQSLKDIFAGDADTLARQVRAQNVAGTAATDIATQFLRIRDEGLPAITQVQTKLAQIRQNFSKDLNENQVKVLLEQIQQVDAAIKTAQDRAKAQQVIQTDPEQRQAILQEAEELTGKSQAVTQEFQKQNEAARQGAQAVNQTNTNLTSTIQQANSAAAAAGRLASNLERAAQAQIIVSRGGQTQAAYFGNVVHKAFGGDLTRGQDQTLVAASAGENIVNARSSARFFAELRAINAGQTPVFREQGGPVTNVGDINVNVDARNASNVDGRQIARTLKREIRRGSTSL